MSGKAQNEKYSHTNMTFIFQWDWENLEKYFSERIPNVVFDCGYHMPLYDSDPKTTIAVDPHTTVGKTRSSIWCHYTPDYLVRLIKKKIKGLKKFKVLVNYSGITTQVSSWISNGSGLMVIGHHFWSVSVKLKLGVERTP